MSKFIALPEEVREKHLRETIDEIESVERKLPSNLVDWRSELIKQLRAEKSKAWFREQELLGQIEGLKRQIR